MNVNMKKYNNNWNLIVRIINNKYSNFKRFVKLNNVNYKVKKNRDLFNYSYHNSIR